MSESQSIDLNEAWVAIHGGIYAIYLPLICPLTYTSYHILGTERTKGTKCDCSLQVARGRPGIQPKSVWFWCSCFITQKPCRALPFGTVIAMAAGSASSLGLQDASGWAHGADTSSSWGPLSDCTASLCLHPLPRNHQKLLDCCTKVYSWVPYIPATTFLWVLSLLSTLDFSITMHSPFPFMKRMGFQGKWNQFWSQY